MTEEIKISLCMVNYYEDYLCAKVVAQCYSFVDEILIGDGSKGKDMLREFMKGCSKVKIIDYPFEEARRGPKFHLARWRNYIQRFATGDWLLWQDPDELYPLIILRNMRKWIKLFNVEAIAFYRCATKDRYRKEFLNVEPKIRLYKNNKKIKWGGDPNQPIKAAKEGQAHDLPLGFKSAQLVAVKYWHDGWITSLHQQIYKFKDKEKQKTITERNKKRFVDPYRDSYKEEDRERYFQSRE